MIIMSKTYTPELTPEVLDRLEDYAAVFRDDFSHKKQAAWSGVYLQGLLHDGERKSIEPLSARVTFPPDLDAKDPEQALQQFVNQSPWDDQALARRYRRHMAETFASPEGIFVFDDTSFPKQGKHSVGVQRQYCGALGKKANCQVAPSVHYVSPTGHYPLAMRLYLPESWIDDKERLDKAGVPAGRSADRRPRAQIALELLDTVRGEGLPGWLVVADAGYGVSEDFRDGLGRARAAVHRRRHRRDGRLHRGAAVGVAGAGRPARRDRRAAAHAAPAGRGLAPAGEPEGAGRRDAAAEGDLARGDQGEAVGPLRLAAGLARRRLGHGRVRRGRADLAADRAAGRRQAEVRLQQPAGRTRRDCGRSGCGRAAGRWSRATSR